MQCLNCDEELALSMPPGSLFCCEVCRQRADTIRYGRRIFRDGRITDPLVEEAFRTKMAFAVTDGGYATKLRELDNAIREAVIDRDQGKCVICGQAGTEIDHIVTSSPDLSNLRLLCHDCHMRKTQENFRRIERGSRAELIWKELMARIRSSKPLRECDDEIGWPTKWRKLASERRAELLRLKSWQSATTLTGSAGIARIRKRS